VPKKNRGRRADAQETRGNDEKRLGSCMYSFAEEESSSQRDGDVLNSNLQRSREPMKRQKDSLGEDRGGKFEKAKKMPRKKASSGD